LLVKSFFEAPVEAVLQRMAGAGGSQEALGSGGERGSASRARGGRASAAAAEDGDVTGGGGDQHVA
jgi:hypothetical protein